MAADDARAAGRPGVLRLPGLVLGIGLGGFVDGILLHQILQWHHLLSSTDTDTVGIPTYPVDTVPGLRMNTLADGLFHVVTWLAVLIGIALLFSRVAGDHRRVWAAGGLWGWILAGWGVFNLVEGVIDHHLLGVHHVREGPGQLWWDLGFLALGGALVVVGLAVVRRSEARTVRRTAAG